MDDHASYLDGAWWTWVTSADGTLIAIERRDAPDRIVLVPDVPSR